MGNQLVAIAPSQIFPVEHYMSDIDDMQFEANLGSTRFFKVALARQGDSSVVVKVFTIQDLSLNLRTHRDQILDIKRALEGAVNCLPFTRAEATDRVGFIVRPFIKYSLYDRISTRPFLRTIEKKWLAFQLLLAIQQAHKHKIVHGDIKLENILVTNWNWLVLADFASFKPTFLPEDNPADFSYFFDTSRRRTCFIAPERFKSRTFGTNNQDVSLSSAQSSSTLSGASSQQFLPDTADNEELDHGELLPSMDIFSAGCSIIELFTEGFAPFSFSQLLAYRAGEYTPEKVLDKLEDVDVKNMVKQMIQPDPNDRLSANDHLTNERHRIFPNYFYVFLQSYMQIFSTDTKMSADQKIFRINNDIDNIIKMCEEKTSEFDSEGLVLISSLVTANITSLRFSNSKLQALSIIVKMSKHLPDEIVLDRIVPYIISLLSDSFSSVRISAIYTLTDCVSQVKFVELSDGNIFPDYILPALLPLCNDNNVLVRASLARCIANIAEQSVRFLDLVMLSGTEADRPLPSYELELSELHNCMAHAVSILLADNANLVRQSLMEHSVTKLAVFFGKLKANDVLLSHMITFLNDKEDAQLRRSFYENIVGIAAFIGWQCSPILLPLLQQGLSDPEEFVISECIAAMGSLTELGLLQKLALYELLQETIPYLLHPNLWIRQAVAGFISSACKTLDNVDIQVKLGTMLRPFLKTRLIQISIPVLILSNLESPIPRSVLDGIIKAPEIEAFFEFLEERNISRNGVMRKSQVKYGDNEQKLKILFKRLVSEGMVSSVENKILYLKENLIKINYNKTLLQSKQKNSSNFVGEVSINKLKLEYGEEQIRIHSIALKEDIRTDVQSADTQTTSALVNEEWQHMFGPETSQPPPEIAQEALPSQNIMNNLPLNSANEHFNPLIEEHTGHTDYDIYDQAPCKIELHNLISKKRYEYSSTVQKKMNIQNRRIDGRPIQSNPWKPRGILIAHLYEHSGGITKLINLPDHPIFASASTDGQIKLWDCSKMEDSYVANKAYHCHNLNFESAVTSLAACAYKNNMAASSEKGKISIFKVGGSEIDAKQIDIENEGPPIHLQFCGTGSSLLVYGTAFGGIIGWDLRAPNHGSPAFRLDNDLRQGLQTAMAISPDQCWVISGNSSGILSAWDLRFSIPIAKCVHPSEARIRDVLIHPTIPATVLAAVQGNNEVGVWNIESQFRSAVLWASGAPVLSTSQPSSQSVCSMFCVASKNTNYLITGGTDMRLRFWDFNAPYNSLIVSSAATETLNRSNVTYKSKMVDGTEVISEIHGKPKSVTTGSEKSVGLDDPPLGHHDWISAVTMCMSTRWYIVSGSRDGVIKIWK